MFCPECGVEYREGFTECSDCRVALVATPPEFNAGPDPGLELVTIFESDNPLEFACAKDALEEAGIPFGEGGDEVGVRLAICPQVRPWFTLRVGSDRKDEARAILESLAVPAEPSPEQDGLT